jgi:hypothetical protein
MATQNNQTPIPSDYSELTAEEEIEEIKAHLQRLEDKRTPEFCSSLAILWDSSRDLIDQDDELREKFSYLVEMYCPSWDLV